MTTPEIATGMHQEVARPTESAQVQCDACPTLFTPKKRWQHFCSPRCRRAWHAWTRPASVREARELVRQVLAGEAEPEKWNPRARRLLGK